LLAPEVAGVEILGLLERAGKKAAAERAVGDDADAEFLAGRQDGGLQVARPQRVLALQRGDRMHLCGAPNGVRRGFGQSEVTHLAGLDQIRHGAHGFLDLDLRVDAVLVVQIDMIDAQTRLRLASQARARTRGSVDAEERAVGTAHVAELGGEHDFLAARFQDLRQQALVGTDAVHVGGVEEVDADVERGIEHAEIGRFIGRAIEVRHAHAAQADGGDLRPCGPSVATRNFHAHGGWSPRRMSVPAC
jgi:hypothetical protein